MKRYPPALGAPILTLGLALAVPLAGIRAQDAPPGGPLPALEAPAAPGTAPAPTAPEAPLDRTPVEEPAPAAPDAEPAPEPAPVTPDPLPPAAEPAPITPDPVQPPAEEPAPVAPDAEVVPPPQPDALLDQEQPPAQEPVPPLEPAPDQPAPLEQPIQPDQPAPIAPDTTPAPLPEQQPITPDQPQAPAVQEGLPEQAPVPMETVHSPMQEFVSHNVHEVGELSRAIDQFQAADRPDLVRVLYHMIRDHVLVSDAAQNVLARRGDVSRPVRMASMAPPPASAEEFVDHQIAHHEQMLAQTEQLLAQATTPEERSVYQQSVNATRRHLNWLRQMDQGQQVALGFFGPTAPLTRIAGYRERIPVTRTNRARRGTRGRR